MPRSGPPSVGARRRVPPPRKGHLADVGHGHESVVRSAGNLLLVLPERVDRARHDLVESLRNRRGVDAKGPVRKLRYEWIGDVPIFNYSRRELELMLGASGFARVEILSPGRSGFSR